MLVLNADLWSTYRIIKINSSSQTHWEKPDSSLMTHCVLRQIKSYLEEMSTSLEKMILIVDLSKGAFPPWIQALSIAKFFVSLKTLLVRSLEFTLMITSTDEQKTWINRILMIYTPARPVHIVESKDEIRYRINEHLRKTKVLSA
jgi:hypothetical protein